MFFVLSKILSFIINPSIWIGAFLIWSLFSKRPEKRKRRLLITVILFFVLSNQIIYKEVLRLWADDEVLMYEVERRGVAVVLSGMVVFNRDLKTAHFTEEADRLMQGLRLYHANKVDKLLVTGGSGSLVDQDLREADYLLQYLMMMGVPASDIILERDARNTYENARNSKELLGEDDKVVLVTSAMHMPRARACFKKMGVNVVSFPSSTAGTERDYKWTHVVLPSPAVLAQWQSLLHEWLGYVAYKIKGYA